MEYLSIVPQTSLVSPDAFSHARNKDAVAISSVPRAAGLVNAVQTRKEKREVVQPELVSTRSGPWVYHTNQLICIPPMSRRQRIFYNSAVADRLGHDDATIIVAPCSAVHCRARGEG